MAKVIPWGLNKATGIKKRTDVVDTVEAVRNNVDAVVDAGGNGDYSTIAAAVDAGFSRIFVLDGSYVQTADLIIDQNDATNLEIIGESRDGVIVDFGAAAYSMIVRGLVRTVAGTANITSGAVVVVGSGTSFITGGILTGDFITIYEPNGATPFSLVSMEVTGSPTTETSVPVKQYNGIASGLVSFVAFKPRKNVTFRNIRFTNSTTNLIELAEVVNLRFENCIFDNGVRAVQFDGVCKNVKFVDCEFVSCTTNFIRNQGVVDGLFVNDCELRHIPSTGTYAINFDGSTVAGFKMFGGTMEACHKGIYYQRTRGAQITGTTFRAINSEIFLVSNLYATHGINYTGCRFEESGISSLLLMDAQSVGSFNGVIVKIMNCDFFEVDGSLRLENCDFIGNNVEKNTGIGSGFGFILGGRNISNNYFDDCGNASDYVISVNAARTVITNNRFRGSKGLDIGNGAANCVITGNTTSTPVNGFLDGAFANSQVCNNIISMNASSTSKNGIRMTGNRAQVSRNIITVAGTTCNGIVVTGDEVQVKDNTIEASGAQNNAIDIQAAADQTWHDGNMISSGFTADVLNNGTNTTVGTNASI